MSLVALGTVRSSVLDQQGRGPFAPTPYGALMSEALSADAPFGTEGLQEGMAEVSAACAVVQASCVQALALNDVRLEGVPDVVPSQEVARRTPATGWRTSARGC